MVLAYSPVLEMANSSLPFQACLAVLLSVVKDVPVQQTIFPTDPVLDTIDEDPDQDGSISEGESDDESDEYRPSRGEMADGNGTTFPLVTRSRHGAGNADSDSELMVLFPLSYLPTS